MEEILKKLYKSLKCVFSKELKTSEKRLDENGEIDVFKTFLTISKSQRDFRNLIEASAISRRELETEFSKLDIDEALKKKLIRRGININENKIFITANGLFEYYSSNNLNLNNVFIALDDFRFTQDKLKLKTQEKLFCIFLILFNACSKETPLNTNLIKIKDLEKYFFFFQIIESELESSGLILGKKVNWGTGKDINFRKFITNNVDLPNTGVYNDRPTAVYWLDFSNKQKTSFLMNLILDNYDADKRILANAIFLDVLRKLSNRMLIELGLIPNDLNSYLVQELTH